jgi:hypothetical protein
MDKTIPAQDQIKKRQRIPDKVRDQESSPGIAVKRLICLNDIRDYIYAKVTLDIHIKLFHPIKIAAWSIEQRTNMQVFQETRQFPPDNARLFQR